MILTISLNSFGFFTLGNKKYYAAYCEEFKQMQLELGTRRLLNRVIPMLAEGVSASAFHALIRLSYGLSSGNDDEVIHSLAYMASSFHSLGSLEGKHLKEQDIDTSSKTTHSSFSDIIGWLERHPTLSKQRIAAKRIFHRLQAVSELEHYDPLKSAIHHCKKIEHRDLQESALSIFLHRPSFTSLHLVTATHAAALLTPHLENPNQILRYLALAIANAYVGIGTPALNQRAEIERYLESNPLPSWPSLTHQALAANSIDIQHNAKMVKTCQEMFEATGQKKYQLAALVWLDRASPWQIDDDKKRAA